jgi:hypothetical protein
MQGRQAVILHNGVIVQNRINAIITAHYFEQLWNFSSVLC